MAADTLTEAITAAHAAQHRADQDAERAHASALARARAVSHVVDLCDGNQRAAGRQLGLDQSRVSRLVAKAAAAGPPALAVDMPTAIREAYTRLVSPSNEWVGLAPLRAALAAYAREDVDQGLRTLMKTRGVHIVPVANLKSLTQADLDAALHVGGHDSHAIAIETDAR